MFLYVKVGVDSRHGSPNVTLQRADGGVTLPPPLLSPRPLLHDAAQVRVRGLLLVAVALEVIVNL